MSFQPLEPEDVVVLDQAHALNGFPTTSQHREMVKKIQDNWVRNGCKDDWFTKGVPCKMLRAGNQWKDGRIRLQIQFDEDAPNA